VIPAGFGDWVILIGLGMGRKPRNYGQENQISDFVKWDFLLSVPFYGGKAIQFLDFNAIQRTT
jgi:hypothetical protein